MYIISLYVDVCNNYVAINRKEQEGRFLTFGKDLNMNNSKVRIRMLESGLKQWEVADMLGISESVFSRKLRNELSEEEQDKIVNLIEQSQNEHALDGQEEGDHNEE